MVGSLALPSAAGAAARQNEAAPRLVASQRVRLFDDAQRVRKGVGCFVRAADSGTKRKPGTAAGTGGTGRCSFLVNSDTVTHRPSLLPDCSILTPD